MQTPNKPVLVIENVALFRQMIAHAIVGSGMAHSTVEVGTLTEARSAWKPGAFHFLVADIHLPDGVAFDFIRQVRSEEPRLPVLAISGRLEASFIREVLSLEVTGFLSKEEDFETFITALRAVSSGQRYFSPVLMDRLLGGHEEETLRMPNLTARELEVARLVADGADIQESAAILGISPETVKVHRHRIFKKLNVPNSRALARKLRHREASPD